MKIIITRPIDDSKKIQELIEVKGYETIINPLLEIEYFNEEIDLTGYKNLIFTSRHAVRALKRSNYPIEDKNIFVSGQSTYEEVLDLGIDNICMPFANVHELIRYLSNYHKAKKASMIYIRGKDISISLIGIKELESINIKEKILYIAHKRCIINTQVIKDLNNNHPFIAIFYSKRTAKIFLEAIENLQLSNKTSIIMAYCLSKDISDIFRCAGIRSEYAKIPTNEGILSLI
tara:strand:+ start:5580 stop:6275 length:696 start_codon:yes stop_codon:yes gene_type:complete